MRLGLTIPFDRVAASSQECLIPHVSGLYQKCHVETNERGTKATSFVRAQLTIMVAPIQASIKFIADHPFVFMMRENFSDAILFVSVVLDPTSS